MYLFANNLHYAVNDNILNSVLLIAICVPVLCACKPSDTQSVILSLSINARGLPAYLLNFIFPDKQK